MMSRQEAGYFGACAELFSIIDQKGDGAITHAESLGAEGGDGLPQGIFSQGFYWARFIFRLYLLCFFGSWISKPFFCLQALSEELDNSKIQRKTLYMSSFESWTG